MSSFENAGFSKEACNYSICDNTVENNFDPYKTLAEILSTTKSPYVLYCHQDVRMDQGDGYRALLERLRELNEKHPNWAVAGNAGVDEIGNRIIRITDPSGVFLATDLPRQVYSLDENFLLIRTASGVRPSSNLKGFHLYATDLCFDAMSRRQTCHVINFHLTHLSAGNAGSDAFGDCASKFVEHWNPRVIYALTETITGYPLRLSRHKLIRRAINLPGVASRMRGRGLVFMPAVQTSTLGRIRVSICATGSVLRAYSRMLAKELTSLGRFSHRLMK